MGAMVSCMPHRVFQPSRAGSYEPLPQSGETLCLLPPPCAIEDDNSERSSEGDEENDFVLVSTQLDFHRRERIECAFHE